MNNPSADAAQLLAYVKAIYGQPSGVILLDYQHDFLKENDADITVNTERGCYRFSNGVTLWRTVEDELDAHSGLACAECWVSCWVEYTAGCGVRVQPERQQFASRCSESAWLRLHGVI